MRIPGAVGPAIGERIRAVAAPEKLHLFTADGRKRIDLYGAVIPGRAAAPEPGITVATGPATN